MDNEKEIQIDKLEILITQKCRNENEILKDINNKNKFVEKIDKILENQGLLKKPSKGLTSLIKKNV